MRRQSGMHIELKCKAREWLRKRGCKDVRSEIPFEHGSIIIDVVGYRDGQPVIGIECGMINAPSRSRYQKLPFPVFRLPYGEKPDHNWEKHASHLWHYLEGRGKD